MQQSVPPSPRAYVLSMPNRTVDRIKIVWREHIVNVSCSVEKLGYPETGSVPRISIGWSTIQTPKTNNSTIIRAQGETALIACEARGACVSAMRNAVYKESKRPKSSIRISRRGTQSATGWQQERCHSVAPQPCQPRSVAKRCQEGTTVS